MSTLRNKWTALALVGLLGGCRLIIGYEDPIVVDGGIAPASCSNGAKDGDETGTDCGGSCLPCAVGQGCKTGPDCESKSCSNGGTCLAPACGDHVQNGTETDVDCGGETCAGCDPGLACKADGDCKNMLCMGGVCVSACTDGLRGGAETDVDCGGAATSGCPACADGNACKVGADCTSGLCVLAVCKRNFAWFQQYGGMGAVTPVAVAADAAGEPVVTGNFTGVVNFGSGPLNGDSGAGDVFVTKLLASGAGLWGKFYGDPQSQIAGGVAVDKSGDVLVTGGFQGKVFFGGSTLTSAGAFDAFVVKLDAAGAHLWSKGFGDGSSQRGAAIGADGGGNVAVLGQFTGTIDFGAKAHTSASNAGGDLFLLDLDASGAYRWSKSFGSAQFNSTTQRLVVDAAGNIIVVANCIGAIDFGDGTPAGAGGIDVCVAKFDPTGALSWSRRFGGVGFKQMGANGVAVDATGDVIVAGNFSGSVDFGAQSLPGDDKNRLFVAALGPDGTPKWARQFGDPVSVLSFNGLAVNAAGTVVVTGSFTGNIDFGGGALTASGSGGDVFVAVLDSAGTFKWNTHFGGVQAQNLMSSGVTFADASTVVTVGTFQGTADFGDGPVASANASNAFLVKLLVP
jgi:hypothetical protein